MGYKVIFAPQSLERLDQIVSVIDQWWGGPTSTQPMRTRKKVRNHTRPAAARSKLMALLEGD